MLAIGLVVAAAPSVFYNQSRPVIGDRNIFRTSRLDQYFSNRPKLKDPYEGAAAFVRARNCSEVGLVLRDNDWEYPFWVLLRRDSVRPVHVEHFGVKNISGTRLRPEFDSAPCALISLDPQSGEEVISREGSYTQAWSMQPVHVLIKRGP
jgi:hypothetical protein